MILLTPPPLPDSNVPGQQFSDADTTGQQEPAKGEKFITADPAAFAQRLKEIDNNNEVLIILKQAAAPRLSKATLRDIGSSKNVLAQAKASAGTIQRTEPGFARADGQSRAAVRGILNAKRLGKVTAPDFGNLITATLPDQAAQGIITALLNSPYVDYVEANQSRPVRFQSAPAARAPAMQISFTDEKISYHNVDDAWNYTKGAGARVGILDSGFSYDQNTNAYHPDGQLLTSGKGIQKLGFVDDFNGLENCDDSNNQPYGGCLPWDDDGHGTEMAGLVGANENSLGHTGVMPEGLTVSMKIAQNCNITQGCSGNTTYQIMDDDFYWAVQWARFNDIDVLSMSFATQSLGTCVTNALYNAFYQDDILLLAGTGNNSNNGSLPRSLLYVMGVGGLDSNGVSYGVNSSEEVAAISGGGTTVGDCVNANNFCKPNGSQNFMAPNGETSFSTAIAAGVAGLVRAHHPSLTAPQVRQRLKNTSVVTSSSSGGSGNQTRLDALRAITGNPPVTVSISGPDIISNSGTYSWEAFPNGGNSSYNYIWYYRENTGQPWQTVGNGKTYSRQVTTDGQDFYLRVRASSGGEIGYDVDFISVNDGDCTDGICE